MIVEELLKYLSHYPLNSEVLVEIACNEDIEYGGIGDINQIQFNVNSFKIVLSHRQEFEDSNDKE